MSVTADSSSSADATAILAGLRRLSDSIKNDMEDRKYCVPGHYQDLPLDIQQSYDIMQQGASLVHATATKYTLMGKISIEEQTKVAQDLLKGCQLIATGALVIANDCYGCCRSTRFHAKRATRAVLATVIQLVEAFVVAGDNGILEKESNLGAQKCGAVWQTCDVFVNKKLPQGNRNAMRRDLFTWMMECNETMQEFQEMIDRGPETASPTTTTTTTKEDIASLEDFFGQAMMASAEDQYTEKELEVAKPAVAMVKCSRGTINVALKASDAAGKALASSAAEQQTTILDWIGKLHEMARRVGEGMTDLGTLLYPTLSLEEIEQQGNKQSQSILDLLQVVLDCNMDLDEETLELANKLRVAAQKRHTELTEAVAKAKV